MAILVISSVSAEGMLSLWLAMLKYCGKSSRKRLLHTKTLMRQVDESWLRRVLQQLAAKEATDALSSSFVEIILPKLRLVVMLWRLIISAVSMQGWPLSSSQVW